MSNGVPPLLLALDENQAFEAVLTDIPLFCVGLMAMGFITFIFVMKQVNPVVLYLCISSLLLFIVAILDLGQLLIRGPMEDPQNINISAVSGFIIGREVGLALSDGFLLLFLWKAVAQCPGSERPRSIRQLNRTSGCLETHSASWTRWGLVGMVLRWLTLVLAIVIPLLQIIWRIIVAQRRYGSVYIAESTLEIVVSAIFVLKVLLNVLVSPSSTWWIPFKSYLGLLLALAITIAIGVGNLVSFAFSETVLGRLLRAISLYVLLLYSLISIFYRKGTTRPTIDDQEVAQMPANQKEPKGLFINTVDIQPQGSQRSPSIMVVDRTIPTPVEKFRPPVRVSTSSRLSTWVNRTISPVLEQSEGSTEIVRSISLRSSRKPPITPAKRPKRPELHFDIITPTPPSRAEQVDLPGDPPTTGISLKYYTMDPDPDPRNSIIDTYPTTSRTDPSVYRLDVPINPDSVSQASLVAQPPSRPTSSLASLDELMRQQSELDKSIANLKLLSLDATITQRPMTAPERSSVAGETPASTKSRPQSTLNDSQSPRSDFSLSVFPEPPQRPESAAEPPNRYVRPFALRRKVARRSFSGSIQTPFTSSIPGSPSQGGVGARLASEGTQYDVTSFIGEPGNQNATTTTPVTVPSSEVQTASIIDSGLGNVCSGDESEPPSYTAASISPVTNLRPMLLPLVASERRVISPVTLPVISRSEAQPAPLVRPRDSSAALKPFLLGTAVGSVPVSLPSSTMVPLGPRRTSRAVRAAAYKAQISIPRASNVLNEDAPEAYERPRAPPSV